MSIISQCLVNCRYSNNTCEMNKRYCERKRQVKSVPWLAFDWACRRVWPNFILCTILIISASYLFIDWTHGYQPWTMCQPCARHGRGESKNITSVFNDCTLAARRRATNPVFHVGQGRQSEDRGLRQEEARAGPLGVWETFQVKAWACPRFWQNKALAHPKYCAKEFGLGPRAVGSCGNIEIL